MHARLVPMTLLAGVAAAVAAVALYQWWWGLLLAAATTLLVLVAAPAGWGTRLPFALGFTGVVGLVALTRGEGDYLITASAAGYTVMGLALVVLMLAIATLPRPGADPRRTDGKAGLE